jgi:hypothetical protein
LRPPTPVSRFVLLLALLAVASCSSDTPPRQQAQPVRPAGPDPAASVRPPAPVADSLIAYTWESEMCQFSGRYDPRRYTKAQLDGTWDVLSRSALLADHAVLLAPEDIAKLSLDSLERHYAQAHAHYLNLQVIPRPVWQQLKKARLREVEADYQAKKLLIQAFTNPQVLLTAAAAKGCRAYVQGLAQQNDSLIRRDWRLLVEEQVKHNGAPQYLKDRFLERAASDDWLGYAKIDLLAFGWWNCANDKIPRAEPTPKMHRQFEQLFTEVKTECEEVD